MTVFRIVMLALAPCLCIKLANFFDMCVSFLCEQNYFGDAWNVFDFIIVLGSIIDIIYTEFHVSIFQAFNKY